MTSPVKGGAFNPSNTTFAKTQNAANLNTGARFTPVNQGLMNITNVNRSIPSPSGNGYTLGRVGDPSVINPRANTSFKLDPPKGVVTNPNQAIQVQAKTVGNFSGAVKNLGLIGQLIALPSVASDFGDAVGYLVNLPQYISNEIERDRLDKLVKKRQREANEAAAQRVGKTNNLSAESSSSRNAAPYVPPFAGGQGAGVAYRININFAVTYYNNLDQVTGSTSGNCYVDAVGPINSVAQIAANIYSGDFVGAVVNDIRVIAANGAIVATLASSTIYPPFGSGTRTRWSLAGITGVSITRKDGLPDTGGNLPNPNPTQTNSETPYVDTGDADDPRSAQYFPYAPVINVGERAAKLAAPSPPISPDDLQRFADAPPAPFAPSIAPPPASPSPSPSNSPKPVEPAVKPTNPVSGASQINTAPAPNTGVRPSTSQNNLQDLIKQPTPAPAPYSPPVGEILTAIGALSALNLGMNQKLDAISANTTPASLRDAAQKGSCDTMNSPLCTAGLKNDIKQPILDKLDLNDVATASILGNQATQNGILAGLTSAIAKITSVLNNTVVDRTLAVMNLATNIHNAAMLTRDIGETLGSVVDNVISLTPLRFTNSEGAQVQFTDFIGSNFRAFLVSVLGVENYTSLVLTWQKANTIYHSAMGVLNTTQSMLDPISSAVEYGMENVSKIGNSLKEDGVVSENSYPAMDETIRARRVNRFERLNDTLEGAENIASNLSSVTSSAVSIKEDYKQLREDAKDLRDKATAFNTADSEARTALKAELPTDITPITLAPAPAEDEN